MKNQRRISLGFTLIEILVVIGIIATLATLTGSFVVSARVKARDQIRQADLNTLYRYLGTAGGTSLAAYWPEGTPTEGDVEALIEAGEAKYGSRLFLQRPRDPRLATSGQSGYQYRYVDGDIVVFANLESQDAAPTLPFGEPTPAGSVGVFVGTGTWATGPNGSDRYYQISN